MDDNHDEVEQEWKEVVEDDTDQVEASVGGIETIDNALNTVVVSELSNGAGKKSHDELVQEFA